VNLHLCAHLVHIAQARARPTARGSPPCAGIFIVAGKAHLAVAVDEPVARRRPLGIGAAGVLRDRFELLFVLPQVFPSRFGLVDVSIGVDDRISLGSSMPDINHKSVAVGDASSEKSAVHHEGTKNTKVWEGSSELPEPVRVRSGRRIGMGFRHAACAGMT
jgi:hypothetical protein